MKIINIAQCVKSVYLPLYPHDAIKEVPMDCMSKTKKRSEMQTEDDLRSASRNWNADDWESYLRTLEVGLSESLSSKTEVNQKAITNNIFELSSSGCSKEVSMVVEQLLAHLSERQALVLRKIFWDGKSERKIAREMKTSRQAVYDLKKRALKNLRKVAQGVLATSPIVQADVLLIADEIEQANENPAA